MSERPKYDPAELAREGLTEEEAEGIRLGLEQIDRGEAVDGAESFARLRAKLDAMTRIRARKSA